MSHATPETEKTIVWVHGDCLRPTNPALRSYPGAPAIFCWDNDLLNQSRISFKRILFIYECLLELPVVIRRGDVAAEIMTFANENGAGRVATVASPSPRFKLIKAEMERNLQVAVLDDDPFLDYSGDFDLKRFSRFWRQAESYAYGAKEQLDLWK